MLKSVHDFSVLVICDCILKKAFTQSQGLSSVTQTTLGHLLVNPFEHTLMVSIKLDVLIIGIREGDQITN